MATITGTSGPDSLNGTNGNDSISGLAGNDTIHGNSGKDTIDGGADDDIIDAGNNADTVNGGDGNDEIYGGPRGQSNTDGLTGGDGADFFYLTYDNGSTSSSPTSGFWSGYTENFLDDYANFGISTLVSTLEEAAAESFFGNIAGSILLTGVGAALESGVKSLLDSIFGHSSPPPPPQTEDIMVVADFDPREDVLFLPLEEGVQVFPIPGSFANTATGESGIGVEFTYGTNSTVFADVFLDTDFLAEFGITSFSTAAQEFIENLLSQSLQFSSVKSTEKPDAGGILNATAVYPFPTEPGSYVSGEVPAAVSDPLALTAPSNTQTRLYGAFGPVTVVGPSVTSTGALVSGTNLGDIVFLTLHGFTPDQWDDAMVVAQVDKNSIIKGFDGDDILNGSSGQDDIDGGAGDDLIYGWTADESPNRDQLVGGTGDDTLFAAKPRDGGRAAADFDGDDSTNGNVGNDTVSFAYSRVGVTANLTSGTGTNDGDPAALTAYTFTRIENLTGTDFADSLTGDYNDNVLQGNAGSDTLDGGGGLDTVSYAENTGKVTVDLPAGRAQEFGDDGTDNANTVVAADKLANFENVIGSAFNDSLTGNTGNDTIHAGTGDDTVDGGAGDDQMSGEDGNDSLFGGDGDDLIGGDAGSDTLDGGGGTDTASYSINPGKVSVNLSTGVAQEHGASGGSDANTVVSTDSLINFENVNGTSFKDAITGDANNNMLQGGAGNDTMQGDDGNDTLSGDAGNDSLVGGEGVNTVSYAENEGKVLISLKPLLQPSGNLRQITDEYGAHGSAAANGVESIDTMDNFQNAIGSAFNDTILGSGADNLLQGNAGSDSIDGAGGSNTASYADNSGLVFLNLADGFAHKHGAAGTSEADSVVGSDTLRNVQNVIATPFNDTLTGSMHNNVFVGSAGSDSILGNGGIDTASYVSSTGKVTLDLSAGTTNEFGAAGTSSANTIVSTDMLLTIENAIGSEFDDALTGDDNDNTLVGGAGDDTVTGGDGNDTFVLAAGDGTDTITDFVQGTDLIGLAGGLTFADLRLSGSDISSGSETLATLTGVTTSQLSQNDFVTLNPDVADDPITDGGGGTSGPDFIFGSNQADTLAGGSGNDTLIGNAGDDDIDGGSDNDVLRSDGGDDTVRAGSGDDTASGGEGNDSVFGGSGDDNLAGASGDDTVLGTADDDELFGGSGADSLLGGSGDDTLIGGPGADTLEGGDGDDIFVLTIGDGIDTITDFKQGVDLIGLSGGLNFEDLAISGSNILSDEETLATLTGVDAASLGEYDFVMV